MKTMIEKYFKPEEALMQSIPNDLSEEEFVRQEEYFSRFLASVYTLLERIKYHCRKLKNCLKRLNFLVRANQR